MEILSHVGGNPGIDCGGFCKFCFFKGADFKNLHKLSLGCRYCPPNKIGCKNCQRIIRDVEQGYKPLNQVLYDLRKDVMEEVFRGLNYRDLKINLGSWADIINYPQILDLITAIKKEDLKVHLGYTSGKTIKDNSFPKKIVAHGVDEVSFSIFSMNPKLRSVWMGDKSSEASYDALQYFCESLEVNASTVVVPGIIEKEDIYQTCAVLEEWGVKSFNLSRFANYKYQGLILNTKPIVKGINPQSYPEFRELVQEISSAFKFKVFGFPAYDPQNNAPYLLSRKKYLSYLMKLPDIRRESTIITGSISRPFLEKIFEKIDNDGYINVIGVEKEICNLITMEDLESVDLKLVKTKVIIPGNVLVHNKQLLKIFSADGKKRRVFRGPSSLSHPLFNQCSEEDFLKHEMNSFKHLINLINS